MSFTPSFKGTIFPVAAMLKALASEVAVEGLNISFFYTFWDLRFRLRRISGMEPLHVVFICRLCELNAATLLCCEGPSA